MNIEEANDFENSDEVMEYIIHVLDNKIVRKFAKHFTVEDIMIYDNIKTVLYSIASRASAYEDTQKKS